MVLPGARRVSEAWRSAERPPIHWWCVPAIGERLATLLSGDPKVGAIEHTCRQFLGDRRELSGLCLGCGEGGAVLSWAKTGRFRSIEAYDLSESAIGAAQTAACREGLDSVVRFRACDVHTLDLPMGRFDVVSADHALHHFSPLVSVLPRINRWLASDGILVVNEYVGPSRFQWPRRQRDLANALLKLVPESYRTYWNSSSVKRSVYRPGRLAIWLSDPSESVESERLRPLLEETFRPLQIRELGGTLLHPLFHEIAHHFIDDTPDALRILDLCFRTEDLLLSAGVLTSDFIYGVYGKRL